MIGRRVDKARWLLSSGEHEKAREILDGLTDLLVRIAWARAPQTLDRDAVAEIAAEAAKDNLAAVAPPPDDIRRVAQRTDLVRLLQVAAGFPLPGIAWLVANPPGTLPRDEARARELAAAVQAAAAECARIFGGLEPLVSADGAATWPALRTSAAERLDTTRAEAPPGLTPERRAELMLRAEGRERLHALLGSLVGTRIERFEIASLMAIGAQFAVYSARDAADGQDVVVKLPRLDYDRPATFGSAEARRARAAARRSFEYLGLAPAGPFPRPVALITAPNVLLGEDRPGWMQSEELYLVEERVEGVTLVEAVSALHRGRAGGEPEIQAFAASLAGQLLGIFAALADGSPPLRFTDLGPRNVIVDPAGRLRLVDAGSLVRLDPPERSAWVTLAYLPPELACAAARGEAVDVDEAALLHGLGRLVFYALTNRVALPGREPDWSDARFAACAPPVRELALGLASGRPDFDPEYAAIAARDAAGGPGGRWEAP